MKLTEREVLHDVTSELPPDAAVAARAVAALEGEAWVPRGAITATVQQHGTLTLTGTVSYEYQRAAAERAVRDVPGVRGVANGVRVDPPAAAAALQSAFEAALTSRVELDAQKVAVAPDRGTVTLTGTVPTWAERRAARAVWTAPAVKHVLDLLAVKWTR